MPGPSGPSPSARLSPVSRNPEPYAGSSGLRTKNPSHRGSSRCHSRLGKNGLALQVDQRRRVVGRGHEAPGKPTKLYRIKNFPAEVQVDTTVYTASIPALQFVTSIEGDIVAMAEFLTTTGVSYRLEEIIKSATERLVIISPFLRVNERIKELLEDKDRLKIDVRVIYGKNELQPEENNWLESMTSIRTSFCKNLHAKCYLNEKEGA